MALISDSLTIKSSLNELSRVYRWVTDIGRKASLPDEMVSDLQLAITEACTNIIRHAYQMEEGHDIIMTAVADPDRITITLRDFGKKIDLNKYYPPYLDEPSEGGYGVFLMLNLMDIVEYDTHGESGTELKLVKFRPRGLR